jgi:hypothetical protein
MSTLLLLSPYTPLLFMGQEWDASTPFFFFADHSEDVAELMRQGRILSFFSHERERAEQMPHPFAESTFLRSKLDWSEAERPGHAGVRALYAALLRLRVTEPCPRERRRGHFEAWAVGEEGVVLERRGPDAERLHVVVAVRGTLEHPLPPLNGKTSTSSGGSFEWRVPMMQRLGQPRPAAQRGARKEASAHVKQRLTVSEELTQRMTPLENTYNGD